MPALFGVALELLRQHPLPEPEPDHAETCPPCTCDLEPIRDLVVTGLGLRLHWLVIGILAGIVFGVWIGAFGYQHFYHGCCRRTAAAPRRRGGGVLVAR